MKDLYYPKKNQSINIDTIRGNLHLLLPTMCQTLSFLGYDITSLTPYNYSGRSNYYHSLFKEETETNLVYISFLMFHSAWQLVFTIACLSHSKPLIYWIRKYVSSAHHENLLLTMGFRPVRKQLQLVKSARTFPDARKTFGEVTPIAIRGVSVKLSGKIIFKYETWRSKKS